MQPGHLIARMKPDYAIFMLFTRHSNAWLNIREWMHSFVLCLDNARKGGKGQYETEGLGSSRRFSSLG